MSKRKADEVRRTRALFPVAALATLLLWCSGNPAFAADSGKIVLRLADSVPATHPISVNGTKFWMDEVTRLTGGQVEFQWFPSEQLGKAKDLLTLAQSGAVDIARIGGSYTPDKLPLTAVDELPEMFDSSCAGSRALWNLTKEGAGGILAQREYTPLGLHVVFAFSNEPYEVQTTASRQVKQPEDIKGLKLKTLGGASDDAARRASAIPVQMSVADLFLSLQRGTVDGRFGGFGSVKANSTEDVLRHSTVGARIGSFAVIAIVNDRVWRTLPKSVQDAMVKAGDVTWRNFCAKEDASRSEIEKDLVDKHGWILYRLTPADSKRWSDTFLPVQEEWAKQLDRRGKPGSAVLEAFRNEIKAGK